MQTQKFTFILTQELVREEYLLRTKLRGMLSSSSGSIEEYSTR